MKNPGSRSVTFVLVTRGARLMLVACRATTNCSPAVFLNPSNYIKRNTASLDRYTIIRNFFLYSAQRTPYTVFHAVGIRTSRTSLFIPQSQLYLKSSIRQFRVSLPTYLESPNKKEDISSNAEPTTDPPHNPHLENYPKFFHRLALSVPHLHRPTKDDLLKVTTSSWERIRVRFKWFTIKSFRRWNADDISAFFTWFLMTQTVWILVGTTTFFSVVFATANSLRLQEYIARAISRYLTAETGVVVAFESAIVPKWKDSRISFKNVYISRRPSGTAADSFIQKKNSNIHKSAARLDVGNHPAYHHEREEEEVAESILQGPSSDINYSLFDLDVDSIDVTLSLWRWLDGKGLVKNVIVKGVRGVLDRRGVQWDPSLDPAEFRHTHQPGDFQLESLQLEDVLITVYQPASFRPYTASIFRGEFKGLRKQWFFYDFLSAENIVGQFDNCLFSLHKPQSIGRTTEEDLKDGQWKRMSRFRIDGVSIDHIQAMSVPDGPISWLTAGKLDAVVDVKFPSHPTDVNINALISEIATNISNAASSQVASIASSVTERIPGQRALAKPPISAPIEENELQVPKHLVIDIDLRFRDLKAAVPLFTSELSYVNNALIRPIVAFINANHTLVPIHCRILKDLDTFDGSWTMWETGLMDDISYKTYNALAHHVSNVNLNRRFKSVGLWSLHMTANAALSTLRKIVSSGQAQGFYQIL